MKIVHLSFSDIRGGAFNAAYRIHCALRASGIDSHMWVNQSYSGDWTVHGPDSFIERALVSLRRRLVTSFLKILKTNNSTLYSPSILSSKWLRRINDSDADIINLHWVQGEMLSIADIGRIKKPIVWTLHDMWAFCGAEHYTEDGRWREGYLSGNRPSGESRFDLNRWVWGRKKKRWQSPINIVSPSKWLADCARTSKLMGNWPIFEIPNAINTEYWSPLGRQFSRELMGLPIDVPLLLFGAMGGASDPRKGFDLLLSALNNLKDFGRHKNLQLVVFGQGAPKTPPQWGFPVHFVGHLFDDLSLKILYNCADVMVIPSRQDNLPLTAMEAQSCGVPVVCFGNSGMTSIVENKISGYIARAFDTKDLANGIDWVLDDPQSTSLRHNSRSAAVEKFDNKIVSDHYKKLYQKILEVK